MFRILYCQYYSISAISLSILRVSWLKVVAYVPSIQFCNFESTLNNELIEMAAQVRVDLEGLVRGNLETPGDPCLFSVTSTL